MAPERVERKAFGEGLSRLNQHTVQMAGLAQQAIRTAVDGLIKRNVDDSKRVFEIDREIFKLQRLVEGECTDLIALYAPVARDLRTVTTVLKISTDLDRIGRGARNIAESALELAHGDPPKPKKFEKISRVADLAIHMVDQAVRAFVERDDRTVREMGQFDDVVDGLYREIFDDLVAGMKDRTLDPSIGAQLVLVNRQIERIADHAVNISDRVVYLVSGESGVHSPKGSAGSSPSPPTPAPAVAPPSGAAPSPPSSDAGAPGEPGPHS
jgi:phosphate transport system protein